MKYQRDGLPCLSGAKLGICGGLYNRWHKQISAYILKKLAIAVTFVFFCSCAYILVARSSGESFNCFSTNLKRLGVSVASLSSLSSPPSLSPSGPELNSEVSTLRFSEINQVTNSEPTRLHNIVFGIGAAAKTWNTRQRYIEQWWRPNEMRGFVWLDRPVANWSKSLPPAKISADTSHFNYTNTRGPRSAIRIARIIKEALHLGLPEVHWFVMGDDDTFFVTENLVKVLSKYDHNLFYYIGSSSETHQQNLEFSYSMGFGGGGFAVSYSLAKALDGILDDCLERYPFLYGSDQRIHACMSELGVPLTKQLGFHQFDIHGDPFGFLSAHPVTPFISMHHLDAINPLFPGMDRVRALQHLSRAIKVEPGGIFQQSICHDLKQNISVSVSWGYVVQIFRGIIPAWELEVPTRTFSSWRRSKGAATYSFNTRPAPEDPCKMSVKYYLASLGVGRDEHVYGNYLRDTIGTECSWKKAMFDRLQWIKVLKDGLDDSWLEAPRRQCCQVADFGRSFMKVHLKSCEDVSSL